MSNDTTQHTPADVRERIKAAIREGVRYVAKADGAYLYEPSVDDTADRILAILRTARGEGEEDGGEFCDLCGEEFDPSELGTVIGPLGEDDGVPRWYRCPRCARAYDAGYQQGQRDPRGDETADPTAPRSEAQGGEADALDLIRWAEARAVALEPVAGNIMPPGTYACYAGDGDDPYMGPGILGAIRAARRGEEQGQERWEDLVFGPIVEAYNEAHAARRGEGGGDGE